MRKLTEPSTPSSKHPSAQNAATGLGIVAIAFWSALALLTKMAGNIPPFELLFLSFLIAFLSSLIFLMATKKRIVQLWRQPIKAWLFSFAAIFVYHALYFSALRTAPAAEASLLAYLWPLLIVIFSIFVERRAFRAKHLVGALLGFGGCAVAILGQSSSLVEANNYIGYFLAFLCALVWSSYSVVNRRFSDVPSEIIGGVCGLVALVALPVHLFTEITVRPNLIQSFYIILLGIGPTGLAFFAWDYATKRGNLQIIGVLSYFAPLFSTLLLIAAGWTEPRWTIIVAALLTIGGAVVATSEYKNRLSEKSAYEGE